MMECSPFIKALYFAVLALYLSISIFSTKNSESTEFQSTNY